jgi:hypothetical protein
MFGPDPSTHDRCTLGGMIGNDACGVHSLTTGRTMHNVEALDLLLADGTRLEVARHDLDDVTARASRGGRVGRLFAGLLALRERVAAAGRRASRTCRGGCRATTSTSCWATTTSTSPGRWWAPRAPARCGGRHGAAAAAAPHRAVSW